MKMFKILHHIIFLVMGIGIAVMPASVMADAIDFSRYSDDDRPDKVGVLVIAVSLGGSCYLEWFAMTLMQSATEGDPDPVKNTEFLAFAVLHVGGITMGTLGPGLGWIILQLRERSS